MDMPVCPPGPLPAKTKQPGKDNTLQALNTPYFHIQETDLDKDVSILKQALTDNWGNWIVGYSVKTNSLPWLLCYMKEQGFYAEIVSGTEYRLVKSLGFPDDQIIYNGPIKEKEIFTNILLAGGLVNLDSSEEPAWLAELSARFPDQTFSVGLRVNCDIASLCPEEVLVEEEGGRFGYCYENGALAEVIRSLRALPNVKISGLHLHSSTQSRTVNVYAALARTAVKIAQEYELNLSYVDMGGGYFGGRDDKPDYRDYFPAICRELRAAFDPKETVLIAEPGVSLISRATTFATTVLDVKPIRNHVFLVTDGSRTNLNPLVTRHVYPHHIEYADAPDDRPAVPSQWVTGFTCMEYDRLFEIKDGPALKKGDRIIYDTAGGYTMCLNPLFIHYFPPVWVTKRDGSLFKARGQWDVEEFMQKNYTEGDTLHE